MPKKTEEKEGTLVKKLNIYFNDKIEKERLEDIIGDKFGNYSKYIIQDRALPDVRDGLKPVQRRILYGMDQLGMHHDKPYKKSARVAGEVMGKYHPHGDSSIYEAMVRLSQDWKSRMILVDMHGNNGSIDGDSAAAMRYTEARLSKSSDYLLKDLAKRTVRFVPNFDDEEYEPVVLPSGFPNLLVNGSTGISAGYATDIPPHNIVEVIDGVVYRIGNPQCTLAQLMKYIPGPDFPTGGIIQGKSGIKSAYKTGSGKVVMRARYTIETGKTVDTIAVTEIPFEVNKAKLVAKMGDIQKAKKVDGFAAVRDESDRDGLRIAIDVKKDNSVDAVLNYLFKYTDLQKNYNFNMVAINNKRPQKLGLLPIVDAYIAHRKDVIVNRTNYELNKALKRIHILEGFMKMIDILDKVIQTIRESKNKKNAQDNLVANYQFSEEQAEAIVVLQLYRLTSTDLTELQKEYKKLNDYVTFLREILSKEKTLEKVIIDELEETKEALKEDRRSTLEDEVAEIVIEESNLVAEEEIQVAVTSAGYVKRTSLRSYNASNPEDGLKEGDSYLISKNLSNMDTLVIFTSLGNFMYSPLFKLPEHKWKDEGTHFGNIVNLQPNEKLVNAYIVKNFDPNIKLLFATKHGMIKQVSLEEFQATRYSKVLRAMKLKAEDEVVSVDMSSIYNEVLVFTNESFINRYSVEDVPVISTQGQGVKSCNVKVDQGESVRFARYVDGMHELVSISQKGNVKRVKISDIELTERPKRGKAIFKPSSAHDFIDCVLLSPTDIANNVILEAKGDSNNSQLALNDIEAVDSENGKAYFNSVENLKSITVSSNIVAVDPKTKEEQPKDDKSPENDKEMDDLISMLGADLDNLE